MIIEHIWNDHFLISISHGYIITEFLDDGGRETNIGNWCNI